MRSRPGLVVWGVAVLAVGLFVIQSALADSDQLTVRFLLDALLIGGCAVIVQRRGVRQTWGSVPEPTALILAGLAALSLWAAGWWLMDLTNNGLEHIAGPLPQQRSILNLSDSLFGVGIQSAAYELEILFAVVLIPLLQAWLLWGIMAPDVEALIGRRNAVVVMGGVFGLFSSLVAVQNVKPGLPWGLASVGGYLLIGWIAALAAAWTGSLWTGVAAHMTFAYASFAWQDDLFRQFGGKGYLDLSWLTVIVLGGFGAMILLQAIRFRMPRPAEAVRRPDRLRERLILPLVVIAAAAILMAARDVDARRTEQTARDTASSQSAAR